MPGKPQRPRPLEAEAGTSKSVPGQVQAIVAWLERHGAEAVRAGMARYAIPSDRAFGIPVGTLRKFSKSLGRNHELATALWDTGRYEARLLTAFLGEADLLTHAQMDRWCRDFDNWAVCDTLCFHLFDRTPHAWGRIAPWSRRRDEFVKRAAFALLASLAGHDKTAADEQFSRCLPLIEQAATDDRNFVKKGVSWALRGIGHRSANLHAAATALARRLTDSSAPSARWVGRDALADLRRPLVARKFASRSSRPV